MRPTRSGGSLPGVKAEEYEAQSREMRIRRERRKVFGFHANPPRN